jgi:hypothetical protein
VHGNAKLPLEVQKLAEMLVKIPETQNWHKCQMTNSVRTRTQATGHLDQYRVQVSHQSWVLRDKGARRMPDIRRVA